MSIPAPWSVAESALALAIPAILLTAGVAAPRRAELASGAALGLALALSAVAAAGPATAADAVGARVDAVTCVMLLLVSALGAVVVRFSRTYLHGEQGLPGHLRWLLLTLGAVCTIAVTNDLLVMVLGWTATSLALHQLLTFFGDRPLALAAAHKKFLVSRLADLCLFGCLALVYREVGTFDLDQLAAWADQHRALPPGMHAAAVLVVAAVALRTAQLPFHGWLTQVMEAPTPVSALLHAGVVNLGGFVLIRLAPWMAYAHAAQLLLVIIGLTSAVLAALVMTTRVSVKVALAWSTCAQMGFMLVQCGLGLWHLALLHIVAHSLYKAHAFLSAGDTVDAWRAGTLRRPPPPPGWGRVGIGLTVTFGAATAGVAALRAAVDLPHAEAGVVYALALLVALSVAPLLARRMVDAVASAALAAQTFGLVLLYGLWHATAAAVAPLPEASPGVAGWVLVGLGFLALFGLKTTLQLQPEGRLARALYAPLFAGLYLDERLTRLTFRLWPPPAKRPSVGAPHLEPVGESA